LLFQGDQQPRMLQQLRQWMLRHHLPILPLLLQRQQQQWGLPRLLLVRRQHGPLLVSYLGLFSLEIEIYLEKIKLSLLSSN
jgi:hypothetical protein